MSLLIPVCNEVICQCLGMVKRMNASDVMWFCVFSGNVLVAFSQLPKGEGR